MRVLFVDDERNVLSGIRRMLRPHHRRWTMRFATSGREALEILELEPMDLVVSDIRMPGMTGIQLLRAIRQRWPHVLRVVLSGESDRDALLQAVGPTHQYLTKPCGQEAMVAALERMDAMLQLVDGVDLTRVAGSFDRLPTPGNAFGAAMAVLDDPKADAARLAEVVRGDLGMSTALLRVANSAYLGLRAEVCSIQHAIALLGLDLTRAILTVAGVLRAPADEPEVQRILARGRWAAGRVRAAVADAEPCLRQQTELAAMLHVVGTLALMGEEPERYEPLLDLPPEERLRAEIETFGASQAVFGAFLLGVWGLPRAVIEAVGHQDDPDADPSTPAGILYAALHRDEVAA